MKDRHPEYFRDYSEGILPDKDLSDRFCRRPFEHIEIMHGHGPDQRQSFGDVYLCCAGWLSVKAGNYLEQDLANIWNSNAARDIRKSILDGSFSYCNHQACPFIQDGTLERRDGLTGRYRDIVERNRSYLSELPLSYLLCYDRSCNLVCPSCRTGKILFSSGDGLSLPLRLNEKLVKDLFGAPHDRRIDLQITGSGDPFASQPFRQLLSTIRARDFPGLRVDLFTNGIMFTPSNWRRLANLHGRIALVSVSIDAASAATYQIVRGGPWPLLMSNLDYIGTLMRNNEIADFATNFVVQARNYREMGDFVRLCRHKGVGKVIFSLVADWHTWTKAEFEKQAIWRSNHESFGDFLNVLQDPDLDDPIVRLGPLTGYRRFALGQSNNQSVT